MKINIKRRRRLYWAGSTFLLMLLVFACVELDSIDINQGTEEEPKYWVNAGDVATFTLKGHINNQATSDETDVRLVVAILVPTSWNARQNTVVTYDPTMLDTETTPLSMSPIPVSDSPTNQPGLTWDAALKNRYGVGTNVLNDMEWVAFQTDKVYTLPTHNNPEFTVHIKCKTGPKNLKAHIGFFINSSKDGLSNDEQYFKMQMSEECFQVVNGTGVEIDFCEYHFNQMEPLAALQDDYITFTFRGDTHDNELINADAIYINATAITESGRRYEIHEKTSKTLMKKEGTDFSNVYSMTMWPTGFFNVDEGEIITKIEYIFTNADGTVVVNQSDEDGEEGDEWFACYLECD